MKYLLRALFYFKSLKWMLLLAALLHGLAAVCKTLYALGLSAFLDGAVGGGGISPGMLPGVLGLLGVHLLLFGLSEAVFGRMMLRGGVLLRRKNGETLLGLSARAGLSPGEMLNFAMRDSGDFHSAAEGLLRGSLFTALSMLLMLGILCRVCWPLALIAFALPVGYNLCVLKCSDRRQREQEKEREQLGSLAGYAEDRLANRAEIRFGGLGAAMDAGHRALLDRWGATRRVLSRFWSLVGAWDTLFFLSYRLVILLLGIFFVGRSAMSYGDIVAFLALSSAFTGFIWDFQAESYREAVAAARRLLQFWSLPKERRDGSPLPWAGEIAVRAEGLSFCYDEARPVLRDVSFSLRKGEALGLVGESGSGKSTLMNLICGFLEPQEGALELGGAAAGRWRLSALREHMAYLPQRTTLVQGTIWENIALREESELTARDRARMAEILADVGLGYLADCGSREEAARRAAGLSQGELQRVGLARCLWKGAELWLLDEPTSALDPETEEGIAALIQTFRQRGITVFAITHRREMLWGFDQVIALKEGRIAPAPKGEAERKEGFPAGRAVK